MSVATPHSIGFTSSSSTTSESPGSAPLTATGPDAPLMRLKSISVTRSSSDRIWPVKQSFVSILTTAPGSTSTTGSMSGPKDQITLSRPMTSCASATATLLPRRRGGRRRGRDRLVLDEHPVGVRERPRASRREVGGDDEAGGDPADRDPVPVAERIVGPVLELVVEREREGGRTDEREDEVEQ